MSNQYLKNHKYIQELIHLDKKFPDRNAFHENVKDLLLKMGKDKEFLKLVIRRNFDDLGYLKQTWSLFNIPYFHIFELDDIVLKIHLFPGALQYIPGWAAHAIHHHNNYILTTNAFFGSGYESLLFEKEVEVNNETLQAKLKVRKHFHQKDWNPSRVDAWEPHVVFIPETLSATMLVWTTDKKRKTDSLRNVKPLKALKKPLRKVIQLLKMEDKFGIANAITFQFYPAENGDGFVAIEEGEYFAPTKAANGEDARDYCMQILFAFIQKAELVEKVYMEEVLNRKETPDFYKPWIKKILAGEIIPEAYHRTEINIPQKSYMLKDIFIASGQEQQI